jgi:hypothetical protein
MLGGLRGTMRLEYLRQRLYWAIGLGCFLTAAVLYGVVYAPVLKDLRAKNIERRYMEKQMDQARMNLTLGRQSAKIAGFARPEKVTVVIEELVRRGKEKGINFLSITPQMIEKGSSFYKVQPVIFEIKSTYEGLGTFLGGLDELESGLVSVRGFLTAPDESNPDQLKTELTVVLYLAV